MRDLTYVGSIFENVVGSEQNVTGEEQFFFRGSKVR